MTKKKKKKQNIFKYLFFSKQNVFVWLFLIIKGLFSRGSIYHANGAHLISGYPGSGKTLFMNQLRNSVDNEKYFFLSNIKEFDGVKTFNLEDIFSNGEQIRSFPTVDEKGRKLYAVIFDEINLQFNRRMNKSSDYNNLFIGLIEFLVSHRHQDVPRVYFIGQKLELQDGQLQSLFKYQHDIIRTKRWPAYWYYKENKKVVFIPRKIDIVNRVKSIDDEFLELNMQRIKIERNSLTTYNTKALGEQYSKLEKVKVL